MRKLFLLLLLFCTIGLHAATYTFTESNTTGISQAASCGGVSTATANFVMTTGTATTGTISTGNVSAGTSESWTFTSASSDPGVTSWDSGNWVVGINISSADSNMTWASSCVFQLNSGGTLVNTVGTLTGQTTSLGSTGLKNHTVSGSAESPSASDRVQVVVVFSCGAPHGNCSVSFTVGTAANGETVASPIVQPTPSSQIIVISQIEQLYGKPEYTDTW